MPSKSTSKAKQESEKNQDDAQQSGTGGAVVRYAIVIALCFFFLKPYLFKPKEEPIAPQTFKVRGETMGTTWNVSIAASPTKIVELNAQGVADKEKEPDEAFNSCEEFLARVIQAKLDFVDSVASTYRPDSQLSLFNQSESTEWFDVAPELARVVQIALDVARQTNGAFDPTVAPLVNMYRFGPNKTPLVELPSDDVVAAARESVGYDKIETRIDPPAIRKSVPNVTLDLSGVAKGFAVDLVAETLEELGLNDYMIEVGGEIRARGLKVDSYKNVQTPWTLGIQKPEIYQRDADSFSRAPDIHCFIRFPNKNASGALATSGDYNNYLQCGAVRFSHIIDPRTGKPTEIVDADAPEATERLGSVSVLSNDANELSCAQVDAYATAFFVLGSEEGLDLANRLLIPVLYLFRSDDAATNVRELRSNPFNTQIESRLSNEPFVDEPVEETTKQ